MRLAHAQAQEKEQRRKARNGPSPARDFRCLWFPRVHRQEEEANPRTSGRCDQLMASRAAAVPQDPGNNVPVCGQVLLARGNVQSREVAARPRPTPVEAADDVGINNRVDVKKMDWVRPGQKLSLAWHSIA